jgi:hypothetical protein
MNARTVKLMPVQMFQVVAPAGGAWQQRLNEVGGVKLLAFGQYGEVGAGVRGAAG